MGENVKHTPAKWADIKGYIVVKGGHTIASVNSYNTSEGKANARLIAAAPDLLEAAKDVIKLFHYHTEDAADAADFAAAVEIQLEAAIAKAEGRP